MSEILTFVASALGLVLGVAVGGTVLAMGLATLVVTSLLSGNREDVDADHRAPGRSLAHA